jgi:hypothetical protein
MKRKIGKFFLLFVFAPLAFSGCFSPWKGNEAALTLLFGGSPGGRAALPEGVVHTIELDGPTGRQSHTAETNTFSVTVMPGYWHVSVRALLNGALYAKGEGGADIIAGQNNTVEIQMNLISTVGNAGITINFLLEKDGVILADDSKDKEFIISTNDSTPPLKSKFTATVNGGFKDVQWFIWGFPVGGGNTITIEAEDYNPGTYQLTVRVIDEYDVPYSSNITFEVR